MEINDYALVIEVNDLDSLVVESDASVKVSSKVDYVVSDMVVLVLNVEDDDVLDEKIGENELG